MKKFIGAGLILFSILYFGVKIGGENTSEEVAIIGQPNSDNSKKVLPESALLEQQEISTVNVIQNPMNKPQEIAVSSEEISNSQIETVSKYLSQIPNGDKSNNVKLLENDLVEYSQLKKDQVDKNILIGYKQFITSTHSNELRNFLNIIHSKL